MLSLGSMALADNIDWLDCYIDSREKGNDDQMTDRIRDFVRRGQAAQKAVDEVEAATVRTESEWSCGHSAGACCAECYSRLAAKATRLQAEVDELRDENANLRRHLRMLPAADDEEPR